MEKKPISRAGFDNLIKELKDLKENQRPEILKTVQWARSLGDLSENADYSAAKEKQRQIDKRIQFIEGVIENAAIIDEECGYAEDNDERIGCIRCILQPDVSSAQPCRSLQDMPFLPSCNSPR